MPIKLNVPYSQKDEVKSLGGSWFANEKTWVIPDMVSDINPFMKWLPSKEGFIVKSPYIVAKAVRTCWKCHNQTPLIALGAKSFYALDYDRPHTPKWTKWDYPILFMDIVTLEEEVIKVLQNEYPFFQQIYSNTAKEKYWANGCSYCKALQGDYFNFMEPNAPFGPGSEDDARRIKVGYLHLKYDYYLSSGLAQNEMYDQVF